MPIFGWGRKKIVIGVCPEGCLFLFLKKEWKRMMKKEKGWFFLNREEIRTIFSHTIDNGRIEIPEDLMEQAGLEREVIVADCGRYVEIWDEKRWKIECERTAMEMEAFYDELDPR